ncbi:hypothetical protein PG994_012701 [Apiospora phragmitis]|uniref:Uncharacterized protein n=1 Tax=Apiospora phragmitis TaxID=2905665 RepID=A0ABR1TDU5_9PEZI
MAIPSKTPGRSETRIRSGASRASSSRTSAYWGDKCKYNPTNFDNAWNDIEKSRSKVNLAGEIHENS